MEKSNINTIAIKLKEYFINPEKHPKEAFLGFLSLTFLLGMASYLIQFQSKDIPITQGSEKIESIDTYVPNNKALLQIKIANYESLDQVIGHFGVVDLYSTPLNPQEKARRLATAVKIVKTPGNPRIFNILLDNGELSPILAYQGEYTVVIRNPKVLGTKVDKPKVRKPKRSVIYEWESL